MSAVTSPVPTLRRITAVRAAIIVVILVVWEALSASGLLFRDVVPSLVAIGGAVVSLLGSGEFYSNLAVTASEIGVALVIGTVAGLAVGILLGANRFVANAFESLVYYL